MFNLGPSKKKVLLTLIPLYILLFPLVLFLLLDVLPILHLTPLADFVLVVGLLFFYIYGVTFGAPIEKLLEKIGLVHHYGGMFDLNLPDVSFLGIVVTGIFYSFLLYLCISFIHFRSNIDKSSKGSKAMRKEGLKSKMVNRTFRAALFMALALILFIFARAVYAIIIAHLE